MRIGDAEVTSLTDAFGTFATLAAAFPALTSEEPWWLPINVFLIQTAGATVLVDTGLGPQPRVFMAEAEAHLLDRLGQAGVAPEDVDVVVHTHLHIDHVGWDHAFPNAEYLVHEDDWSFFMRPESLAVRAHLRDKVLPLHEAGRVRLVDGEASVAPGVRVVPTPGHTPGHMSVEVGSEGDRLVVLGDVAVHELQLEDPGLQYASDEEPARAAATRREVLGRLADERVPVIFAHFGGPSRLTRLGEGFAWEPAKDGAVPVE